MPRVIQPLGGDGDLRASLNLFVLLDEPSLLSQITVWAQLSTHTVYAACPQDTFPSEVYYILFLKALPPTPTTTHTMSSARESIKNNLLHHDQALLFETNIAVHNEAAFKDNGQSRIHWELYL